MQGSDASTIFISHPLSPLFLSPLYIGIIGPSVRASRQVVDVSDSEDDEPGAINMSAPMPNIATGGSLEGSSLDSPGEGYDGPDGDGGEGGDGDGMYEYSDSEEGDMNARPTVAPKPQVLKSIMKKR